MPVLKLIVKQFNQLWDNVIIQYFKVGITINITSEEKWAKQSAISTNTHPNSYLRPFVAPSIVKIWRSPSWEFGRYANSLLHSYKTPPHRQSQHSPENEDFVLGSKTIRRSSFFERNHRLSIHGKFLFDMNAISNQAS